MVLLDLLHESLIEHTALEVDRVFHSDQILLQLLNGRCLLLNELFLQLELGFLFLNSLF